MSQTHTAATEFTPTSHATMRRMLPTKNIVPFAIETMHRQELVILLDRAHQDIEYANQDLTKHLATSTGDMFTDPARIALRARRAYWQRVFDASLFEVSDRIAHYTNEFGA